MPNKKNQTRRKTAKPSRKKPQRRRKVTRKVKMSISSAVSIAIVILILIFLPRLVHVSPEVESGAKVPSGSWRYGIDLSHNNEGEIVWDSLYVMTDFRGRTLRDPYKAKDIKPVSFVFIKATEGVSLQDEDFKKNWKNAGRSGLRRGAYHYFISSRDGKLQAQNFISTVGDLRMDDMAPVLDIEKMHRGCSRELMNKRALDWLKTIEKHYGKKPIVYSGATFAKDCLSPEITDNYRMWIAHYEKDRPDYEGWIWWQFTDKAVVKGVPGLVDLSVMKIE